MTLGDNWAIETITGGTAHLYRQSFELTPLDYCARYMLSVALNVGLRVWLRGEVVCAGEGPLRADVTDYVSLDDNLLEIEVAGSDECVFVPARVWLEAVPCDEVDSL